MRGPPPKAADRRQRRNAHPGITVIEAGSKEPATFVPEPPASLLKVTKERWSAFWASPVARAVDPAADGQRLERWIRAVDEWHRVGREFRKARLVSGSMGQPVLNPLAAYLNQLEQQIAKSETEFGLTPMSRLRLGIAVGQAKLTADELNRRLSQREPVAVPVITESDIWEAEWEEA